MRIKICGITTPRDAVIAESLGADAIGVVVCSKSQRNVTLKRAREIFSALKPTTKKILVTDSESYPELELMMAQKPDAVQITHPFEFSERPPVRIIRTLKPGMEELPSDCDAFVIDGSMGRGVFFDRNFASGIINRTEKPVFLAGGLSPDNIGEAVRIMNPYGVDVSSGVEKSPGIKDRKKMSEFIRLCREA